MSSPKISLRGVTKAFGAKQVLRGIDLDVAAGESVVVIGGSGTGKSVLLKCILGLMQPDDGSIKIDGVETVELGDNGRSHLAMVGVHATWFSTIAPITRSKFSV